MAVLTDRLGSSMQDELLRLTGTPGNPYEAVSATGDGGGGYKHYGSGNRLCSWSIRANAASGSPSVVTTIVAASDSSGTGATTIATFAAVTASQVVDTGSLAVPPRQSGFIPDGKPYIKALNTFSGTGSLTMAVLTDPVDTSAP